MPGMSHRELSDLVNETARRIRRETLAALVGTDLAPHQGRALRYVSRHAPVRPGQLATDLRIAPRSATDVIDALVQQGLVHREPDPSDRRAVLLSLTGRGAEVAAALDDARTAVARRLFESLSEGERVALGRQLRRVLDS